MLNRAGVQSTTLALLLLLLGRGAVGAPGDPKARAADLFEQGVRQFSSADYAASAQSFLAADEASPNSRALVNGITAARRAGLHLIVARAAERALGRQDMDPGGTALAREALAEAARNLTRVELTCVPVPCTVTVDGAVVAVGPGYIVPGTHDFVGAGGDGATASEHLSGVAGASYRVALVLKVPAAPSASASALPPNGVAPQETLASPPRVEQPARSTSGRKKPLPPTVFVVGAAGTAALVALTTWSGVDTLAAKSEVHGDPERWPHVQQLALRTDLLLTGAVILGAATGAAGLWFVNWGSGARATAFFLPGGAAIATEGEF